MLSAHPCDGRLRHVGRLQVVARPLHLRVQLLQHPQLRVQRRRAVLLRLLARLVAVVAARAVHPAVPLELIMLLAPPPLALPLGRLQQSKQAR